MAEELQQLLEKIQHDGVEKANAEAAAILAKAKAEAAAVLKDAETKAAALRAQAETDARAFEERARKTISQALGAVQADVAVGAKLAAALKAQLAADAAKGVQVVLDETTGAGFALRLDGGRVEYDFSEAAIAAALAKRLRPDLARIVCG